MNSYQDDFDDFERVELVNEFSDRPEILLVDYSTGNTVKITPHYIIDRLPDAFFEGYHCICDEQWAGPSCSELVANGIL